MKVYKEIRNELKKYDKSLNLEKGAGLADKKEIILLTKTDILPEDTKEKVIAKKVKEFEKTENPVFTISLFDDKAIKEFTDALVKYLKKAK